MSSDVLFRLTKGPKPRDIQLTMIYPKENQQFDICEYL